MDFKVSATMVEMLISRQMSDLGPSRFAFLKTFSILLVFCTTIICANPSIAAQKPDDPACAIAGAIRGAAFPESENPFHPPLVERARSLGLEIRDAQDSDRRELEVFLKSQRAQLGYAPGEGETNGAPTDEDLVRLTASYRGNNGHLLVLRSECKIIGTAGLYKLNGKTAEIRKIYLAPEWRGKGLGTPILDHLLEEAAYRGYSFVELETLRRMTDAKALYIKKGFKRFYPKRIEVEEAAGLDIEAYYTEVTPKPRPVRMRGMQVARGLTRGLTRGLGPEEETPEQKRYREKYEKEVNPAFLKEITENPKFGTAVYEAYLRDELRRDPKKREIYRQLGIVVDDKGHIHFSKHGDLVKFYVEACDKLGIPPESRLDPALMYGRYIGLGDFEYTTVVPGVTSFPKQRGFEPVGRAPDAEFIKALQRRHMILSNFHDIHHLLVNLMYPHFGPLMVKAFQAHPEGRIPFMAMRRLSYAMESLALVEPTRRNAVLALVETPGVRSRVGEKIPFAEFSRHAETLSHEALLSRALKFGDQFESQVDAYNGAMMSSTERGLELIAFRKQFSEPRDAILDLFPETQVRQTYRSTTAAVDFIPLARASLPTFNSKLQLPRESFLEDPMTFTTKLDLLRSGLESALGEKPNDAIRVARYEKALRLQIARMEYFLYAASHRVSVGKWVAAMNDATLKDFDEVREFMRDSFGAGSVTYRMLFEEDFR